MVVLFLFVLFFVVFFLKKNHFHKLFDSDAFSPYSLIHSLFLFFFFIFDDYDQNSFMFFILFCSVLFCDCVCVFFFSSFLPHSRINIITHRFVYLFGFYVFFLLILIHNLLFILISVALYFLAEKLWINEWKMTTDKWTASIFLCVSMS